MNLVADLKGKTSLLTRLMNSIKNALDKTYISNCYFWTDFQVSICWIAVHDKECKAFTEKNVREIRRNTLNSNSFY